MKSADHIILYGELGKRAGGSSGDSAPGFVVLHATQNWYDESQLSGKERVIQDESRTAMRFDVIELEDRYRNWARDVLVTEWGGSEVVSRGRLLDTGNLPGYIALVADEPAGLVTYRVEGIECELVTMNSLIEGIGIGSALVGRVAEVGKDAGCSRLWLITTNDNTKALRFYQKVGFRIAAVHVGAIEESRKLKPSIPMLGMDGIPIRDEIELEMEL